MRKNINLHTQEAQQTPSKINIKNKYLIYSQTAESQKQKILKAARKTNKPYPVQWSNSVLMADFSSEMMEAKGN